jgi:hypothetical protein
MNSCGSIRGALAERSANIRRDLNGMVDLTKRLDAKGNVRTVGSGRAGSWAVPGDRNWEVTIA